MILVSISSNLFTQQISLAQSISPIEMNRIYDEVKTPNKYGMVMVHPDTANMIDCATVFRKDSLWYLTYLVYNGRGYETWIAKSKDLLNWEELGLVLPFTNEKRWDFNQSAGYPALVDCNWGGNYTIEKFKRRYWMSYFGSNTGGYEKGMLAIGMAHTKNNPTKAHPWKRHKKPIMTSVDDDAKPWENKKLFKSTVIWDPTEKTGKPFVMYYNAVGDTTNKLNWVERIGMATSDDMIHWDRYEGNPILDHQTGLTGDAFIQKIDSMYVMFYFGAFWPAERKDAFNNFACSKDLVNWTDWTGPDLINSSESFDSKFAHKPCVVKWTGVVYHFYTAVNEKEQRGIAVATSKDLGKSSLAFKPVKNKLKR